MLELRQWYVMGSVGLIAYVSAVHFLEFWRGFRVIRLQKGLSFIASIGELLLNSNRRYGGYVVHVGVLLIFIAIAGIVYQTEADFSLKPGESFNFRGYRLTYEKPLIKESKHKTEMKATVTLYEGDRTLARLNPAKFFYRASEQPTTEVDIYQAPLKDIYLILGRLDPSTGRADFRVTINPFISFIWLGGLVVLFGAVLLLLSRGRPLKSGEVVAVFALISCLYLFTPVVHAQGLESPEKTQVHVETGEDPFAVMTEGDPLLGRLKVVSQKNSLSMWWVCPDVA